MDFDLLLLFVSLWFLGGGIYLFHQDYNRSKYGFHTTGKVIQVKGEWSYGGSSTSYMYYPVVQFYTEDSQLLEQKLQAGASIPLYRKGQTVAIVYYQGQVYPKGIGWQLLYWFIFLLGLGMTLYQIYYW